MNDSDILEVMGWKDVTMLRRYTAAVGSETKPSIVTPAASAAMRSARRFSGLNPTGMAIRAVSR